MTRRPRACRAARRTVPALVILVLLAGTVQAGSAGTPRGASPAPADNAARPPAATTWDVETSVRIAVENHPQVGQAKAEVEAARSRKGQAASAYYPSISLSSGASRSRAFSPSTETSATVNNFFVQGNASQILTDFGRTRASVRRARDLQTAAAESERATRYDVVFGARVAFYNTLRAERILRSRRETVGQRESLLKQAQAFYEAGIRARIEVARAESSLYQARAELTAAESDLQIARVALLNRMGIDGPEDFRLVDSLEATTVPGTVQEWIAYAEANVPDLAVLIARERAAAAALSQAQSGYLPTLTGNAAYGYAADEMPLQEGYSLAVLLNVPLFTGFLTREQVAEARANLTEAHLAVVDLRRTVRLRVEQAALSLQATSDQIAARRKEKDASEENLRLATGRYEVGAGDIIEIVDAQTQMTQSETDLIGAQFDRSISVATLLRAMGR